MIGDIIVKSTDEINKMTTELSGKEIKLHSCGGNHDGKPGSGAPKQNLQLKVKLLTVSDRAFTNSYESGDLSG
jgi:hypothetical protein